ncbi:MAG: ATP-dependent DNA ligase, partial [Candidatus Methylomirabilota bacterium]
IGSRAELTRQVADFLRKAPAADRPLAARLLLGRPFPDGDARRLSISPMTLRRVIGRLIGTAGASSAGRVETARAIESRLVEAAWIATPPPLTIREVVRTFELLASLRGRAGRGDRERLLQGLFERATATEASFLVQCCRGEMRHGVSESRLLDSLARATELPPGVIRRAAMFLGDLGETVERAFGPNRLGLEAAVPRLFRPVKPMLPQAVQSLETAWESAPGQLAVEFNLDGARVQIHVERDEVRLFSRRLHDVTDNFPVIVAEIRGALAARRAILEGEILAVEPDGRPCPPQSTRQYFRRTRTAKNSDSETPCRLFLFDLLLDGQEVLVDRTYQERWTRLLAAHGGLPLVPRCVPRTCSEAKAFWEEAIEAGHAGVVFKRLDSRYSPGLRSSAWSKLTRSNRLDLVITAAEYGDGRWRECFTTFHLAARDESSGELRSIGKTFRSATDDEARRLTARLHALKRFEEGGVVWVEPDLVAEVEYGRITRSSLTPDGIALRFARIVSLREDMLPGDADTIQHVRRLFAAPRIVSTEGRAGG